ncbi:DedA family protein [Calidifontibacter sp. DB0510]|uniref:DedA family protein n=1 Tax=Metallococcus carri TaxID=1656884 RepID=A0A967AYV3_9MICO|nr:VTT domain-containing protein [Metallococcus carri]NHN54253.1 DedA family protein [Metallococcus carri]NOP36907.1 DedA family protein [Calidifontibacter sp. DB2511S]
MTPEPSSTPDPVSDETSAEASGETAAEQKPWWDDPRMPWQGKPTQADLRCWAAIALLGVYGIAMLPLRPVLLGLNSYLLACVTGSNIAMVDIGARLRIGPEPWWWAGLLAAALTSIKFDWVFWWAGKLWGHRIIEVWGGRSRWAARTGRYAEQLARRFGGPAVFLVWFIPFVPSAIVNAFVGDVGMRLRKFLLIDFAAAVVYRGIWMYVGYRVGQPAHDLVTTIARYSNYLAIATLVVVFFGVWNRQRRDKAAAA